MMQPGAARSSPQPQARSSWNGPGFTLLELMVVLVIALMALAVVLPRFSALLPGVELKGSSQQVAALLRQIRSQAIAESREITLRVVSSEANEGEATAPSDGPGHLVLNDGERDYPLPDSLVMTYVPEHSAMSAGNENFIRFYPDGSSNGGTLSLSDGQRQYRIEINWLTGKVSIDGGNSG